jgi:hypothetical protein
MEYYWLLILFLVLVVGFLLLLRGVDHLDTTAPGYRIGNIIGFWYTRNHHDKSLENPYEMAAGHTGTFAEHLLKVKASHLVDDSMKNVMTDDPFWWDQMDAYKKLAPQFNVSLRNAIQSFKGWDFTDAIDPNACVVHMRTGDFLKENDRTMQVDELIKASDRLPREPSVFDVLNGGKSHDDKNESSSDIKTKSDAVIDELISKLQTKFPNSRVNKIESENADKDFYRMVHAPMLLTGLGSFATMAAAANTNFRLTPAFSVRSGGRNNVKADNICENWFTYV